MELIPGLSMLELAATAIIMGAVAVIGWFSLQTWGDDRW